MKESYLVLSSDLQVLDFQEAGFWGWEGHKRCVQTVLQFFPLHPGDVIVLNDPSAGGLFPWAITAIHRLDERFVARSLAIPIPWSLSEKIDREALRIPPTPLVQAGQVQEEIFQSLIRHPMAGPNLESGLRSLIDPRGLKRFLSKTALLPQRHSIFEKIRQDLPTAEARAEMSLDTGEILKLKVETSDRGFTFDFSGSSPGQSCFLGETFVQGLCHEYLRQFLNLDRSQRVQLPSITQFLTPKTSFLHSRYPQGQLQGLARGSAFIWQALQRCFQTIYARQTAPMHNFFSPWIQIQSTDSLAQWILPTGTGCTEREPGLAAFALDGIAQIPSVEDLQRFFEVHEISLNSPQTISRLSPGPGLHLSLVAKETLQILWILENSPSALKVPVKYSNLGPSSIEVRGEILAPRGSTELKAGESLIINTGSGAGLL